MIIKRKIELQLILNFIGKIFDGSPFPKGYHGLKQPSGMRLQ